MVKARKKVVVEKPDAVYDVYSGAYVLPVRKSNVYIGVYSPRDSGSEKSFASHMKTICDNDLTFRYFVLHLSGSATLPSASFFHAGFPQIRGDGKDVEPYVRRYFKDSFMSLQQPTFEENDLFGRVAEYVASKITGKRDTGIHTKAGTRNNGSFEPVPRIERGSRLPVPVNAVELYTSLLQYVRK